LGIRSLWWNTWLPCLMLGGAAVLVLIGKHLSGTIIVGCIGLFMLIVAGCKLLWLFCTVIPAGIVGIGAFIAMNPYALKRITTFTDENADKLDELYQTTQSIYAIGSGGLFGVGLGESRQKYSFLTQSHTDFIFSIWCEEWGFIGAVVLIIIFLLFAWRGYVIAQRAPDRFTQLTAFGITTHVALQAFLNMCVSADIIMNTGITLPFFSYGGSSLVVLMAEMGILLCISRQSYKKKADIEREEMMKQIGLG
ncbi:MAG: cell division protein FtsW, partial [Ruminococcaceae bacterium]|nr:cell division protein FtsW [Oscillospiraceae bacterium]